MRIVLLKLRQSHISAEIGLFRRAKLSAYAT